MPTVFDSELLDHGIQMINSRPHHPQTNGKLERFHRTLKTKMGRHDNLDDFVTYYNGRRLHWSPGIDNCQTPPKAFHDKAAHKTIRVDNSNWMEVDIHRYQTGKGVRTWFCHNTDMILLQYS